MINLDIEVVSVLLCCLCAFVAGVGVGFLWS
mgnify:FL=1